MLKINFKNLLTNLKKLILSLDKLSNRLSKVQADNQLRFQDVENALSSGEVNQKLTSIPKEQAEKKFTRLFTTTRFGLNFI